MIISEIFNADQGEIIRAASRVVVVRSIMISGSVTLWIKAKNVK